MSIDRRENKGQLWEIPRQTGYQSPPMWNRRVLPGPFDIPTNHQSNKINIPEPTKLQISFRAHSLSPPRKTTALMGTVQLVQDHSWLLHQPQSRLGNLHNFHRKALWKTGSKQNKITHESVTTIQHKQPSNPEPSNPRETLHFSFRCSSATCERSVDMHLHI